MEITNSVGNVFRQAEDGTRDGHVTGVQTCALPICRDTRFARREPGLWAPPGPRGSDTVAGDAVTDVAAMSTRGGEIGRASCRERGESAVGGDSVGITRRIVG